MGLDTHTMTRADWITPTHDKVEDLQKTVGQTTLSGESVWEQNPFSLIWNEYNMYYGILFAF